MINKASAIAVFVFSFNQNSYAESPSVLDFNDENAKEVVWPGYVTQSFESQGLLCYELVKTELYKVSQSKPQEFDKNSRFISCTESKKDITQSGNRYVKVTGQIIGTQISDNFEYPVVIADKIRKLKPLHFIDPNIGKIKPRISRSRLDYVLNNSGR